MPQGLTTILYCCRYDLDDTIHLLDVNSRTYKLSFVIAKERGTSLLPAHFKCALSNMKKPVFGSGGVGAEY